MGPVNDIEQLVKNTRAETSPEIDEQILSSAQAALESSAQAQPNIWRTIMKNRITKFAVAAVIIIAALIGVTRFGGLIDGSSKVYAMSDVPELFRSAQTLHTKVWDYVPESSQPGPMEPGQVQRRVLLENWFDMENGLSRTMGIGYSIMPEEATTITLGETIINGEYRMSINHSGKSVTFEKLTPFQQKLRIHQSLYRMHTEMFGDPCTVANAVKVGQEVIDGQQYDIWTYEAKDPTSSFAHKAKFWLSPFTGRIARGLAWIKHGDEDWELQYEIAKMEWDVIMPEGIFATEVPEGYTPTNTKDAARVPELSTGGGCGINELSYSANIAFTLGDGSVILAWHSEDGEDGEDGTSQVSIFESLEAGGPLPKLPIEIYGLVPIGINEHIIFHGRHLLYTQKASTYYEWAIYVAEQSPPPRKDFHYYSDLNRFNPPDRVRGSVSLSVSQDLLIQTPEDFDTWVLGAMAELSDNGKASDNITYESVLQLAQQIRESSTE